MKKLLLLPLLFLTFACSTDEENEDENNDTTNNILELTKSFNLKYKILK